MSCPVSQIASSVSYHRPEGLPGVELFHARDASFRHKPHFHEAWTIWFNPRGAERYIRKGGRTVLTPGNLSIIPPGEVHENHAMDETRSLMSFYVDEEAMLRVRDQLPGRHCGSALEYTIVHDPILARSLARLHRVLQVSGDLMTNQSAFLDGFGKLFMEHGSGVAAEGRPDRDVTRVHRAMEIMRSHMVDNLGLEELAGRCRCTSRHLTRLFKAHLGITPHGWLLALRLEHARRMLVSGRPISLAAQESGFADQSHLTRHFRVRYGKTPAAYSP